VDRSTRPDEHDGEEEAREDLDAHPDAADLDRRHGAHQRGTEREVGLGTVRTDDPDQPEEGRRRHRRQQQRDALALRVRSASRAAPPPDSDADEREDDPGPEHPHACRVVGDGQRWEDGQEGAREQQRLEAGTADRVEPDPPPPTPVLVRDRLLIRSVPLLSRGG
jgi:hypothetical protein